MAWRDRDWAKWSDDERRRHVGSGGMSRRPRSVWRRDLSALEVVAVVLACVGVASFLARLDGSGSAQLLPLPGLGGPEPGGSWPDGVVPYFNGAPEHRWAVRQAVDAWNASGADVRFVPTDRAAAKVVVQSAAHQPCGHGVATLGYAEHSTVSVFVPSDAPGCDRFSAARVLAHELGHVLGLDHDEAACAAMNPEGSYGGSSQCPRGEAWQWRCRLLEQADVRAAVEQYGGAPAPVRPRPLCSLYQPPDAPGPIRLVQERSSATQLALAFGRPPDPTTPRFLGGGGQASFAFTYRHGECVDRPYDGRYRWSVGPGGQQLVFQPVHGSGVHCLQVWALDAFGRRSRASSSIRVSVG